MVEAKIIKFFASFYVVLMCLQYMPIEGFAVSNIKVGAMAVAGVITIRCVPYISKATIWCLLYLGVTLISAVLYNNQYRSFSLIYFSLFLIMFNMYYGLIHKGAFTAEFYIKLLKGLIFAYLICLVAQQITSIVGIMEIPLFNKLYVFSGRGILTGNSLAIEPSHAARIMGFAFYAFLKVSEIKNGMPLSFRQLFVDNKWLTWGFLWVMTTMGSGTAFVVLAALSLYFIRKEYILVIVPALLILYFTIPLIDNFSLNRARAVIAVAVTGDTEDMKETDGSATVRINPILNTFKNLDLISAEQWLGKGTDTANKRGVYSDKNQMGIISDYGLLAFIIGAILIYTCCITRFFSIETAMIFMFLSFTASNIAYVWGCYMLLVPVKYFFNRYNQLQDE